MKSVEHNIVLKFLAGVFEKLCDAQLRWRYCILWQVQVFKKDVNKSLLWMNVLSWGKKMAMYDSSVKIWAVLCNFIWNVKTVKPPYRRRNTAPYKYELMIFSAADLSCSVNLIWSQNDDHNSVASCTRVAECQPALCAKHGLSNLTSTPPQWAPENNSAELDRLWQGGLVSRQQAQ